MKSTKESFVSSVTFIMSLKNSINQSNLRKNAEV